MLVSCILPTRNRGHLIGVALASYAAQDWQHRELIVVDDGSTPVGDMLKGLPNVTYAHLPPQPTLSHKRNLAIRLARGEVICHFDDDDWSAPGRIRDQAERLLHTPGAQVSGYHSVLFWDEVTRRASRYAHSPGYSWGPMLCYRRDYAERNPWPEQCDFAEDNRFLFDARSAGALVSADAGALMVLRLHSWNTRRSEAGKHPFWREVASAELPAAFRQAAGIERSEAA